MPVPAFKWVNNAFLRFSAREQRRRAEQEAAAQLESSINDIVEQQAWSEDARAALIAAEDDPSILYSRAHDEALDNAAVPSHSLLTNVALAQTLPPVLHEPQYFDQSLPLVASPPLPAPRAPVAVDACGRLRSVLFEL